MSNPTITPASKTTANTLANATPSPTSTIPKYRRVPGGKSWASAMFRFGADSFTYAARLIENLDRFHFQSRGDLTSVLNTALNTFPGETSAVAPAATTAATPTLAPAPAANQNLNPDLKTITLYCRGIEIATFTEDDIEIKRATATFAFDDHLVEKLRSFGIPEAFEIPLNREKEKGQK